MNWSWKLGNIAGIGVYLHPTFLIVPAFIWLTTLAAGGGVVAAVASIAVVLAIFGCVLLHELGHALMARHYGIVTRDITLLPIGGLARLERMPEQPSQEMAIALAGPAVNVVIAASLAIGLALGGGSLSSALPDAGSFVGILLGANVALVLFNLLPAFPMDGGRVLRAALAMRMPYIRATRIAAHVGRGLAVLMGVVGLFGNWTLLLIALFIYFAASSEAQRVEQMSPADEVNVDDLSGSQRHASQWGSQSNSVWPAPHHTWDIRNSRGQWRQGGSEHGA